MQQQYERFEGTIGKTLADSTPWWAEPPHPGADAPNVVVVLIDDLGFSHFGCYGSTIDTPNIDRLAGERLAVHELPRDAAVLPHPRVAAHRPEPPRGRHARGEQLEHRLPAHDRPHLARTRRPSAEVLRDEGYATFAVGKWHLCQMEQACAAGPYDNWPCQRGFDRFYGFLDGETDQFHPELVADNHFIDPPRTGRGGLPPVRGPRRPVDQARSRTRGRSDPTSRSSSTSRSARRTRRTRRRPGTSRSTAGSSTPAGTSIARRVVREAEGARPRPRRTPTSRRATRASRPGTTSPRTHRSLAARLQEAFAAFLEHTDAQIGRLVDELEARGELDNTMIVLLSDNGASQEGGPFGVLHEWKFFNFIIETPDEAVARVDDIGGPNSHSNYPWGWAQAGNTPFKWYKQNTHEGGVHVPCIVHWPARLDGTHRPAPPVPPRERRRPHHLRGARRHAARRVPRVRADAGDRHVDALELHRRARRAEREAGAVLRDGRPPRHLGGRLEGGHAPPAGHAVRRRPVGAVPRRGRPLRVPRPRGRRARAAGRDGRPLVGRGRGARRAPPRRPRHRAVRRSLPRRLTAPGRPPLHVPTADVVDARAGRRADRWPQLGPRRADRAGRRRERRALRDRHRQLRCERVRPGRAAGARLQRVRHPPRGGVRPRGARRRVDRRRAVPPHRARRATPRSSSTARSAAGSTCPS